jgi:TPR repeat protein
LDGRGVEKDEKKGIHFSELAAIGGNVKSRHYLGLREYTSGHMDKAIKHFTLQQVSASVSLKLIQISFMAGDATRGDYEDALRAYQ